MKSGGLGVTLRAFLYHQSNGTYEQVWQSENNKHLNDEWIRAQSTVVIRDKINLVIEASKTGKRQTLFAFH